MTNTPDFPAVTITALKISPKPVHLTCCPVTLNPLTPEAKIIVTQFDPSANTFVGKTTARAYGPILLDNGEMVEVHRFYQDVSGSFKKEIHWLGVIDNMIRVRMRDIGDNPETVPGHIDLVDMSFPVCPDVSRPLSRSVFYFQGDYRADEQFTDTFSGVFKLQIDDCEFHCLKMTTVRESMENRCVETFINQDTGGVVLTRTLSNGKIISFQTVCSEMDV